MKSRVDHDDIALPDLGAGMFKILRGNHSPFALGYGHRNACAAQTPQRIIANAWRIFRNVYGRVHMGAPVHDPLPLHLVDPVLGVEFIDHDIDTGG